MHMNVKLGKYLWMISQKSSIKKVTYAGPTASELDLQMHTAEQQSGRMLT